MIRRLPILLLTLALGGCSWLGARDGEPALEPPDPSAIESPLRVKTVWREDVGSGQAASAYALVPAVQDQRLYLARPQGVVRAMDALSGKTLWRVDLERMLSGGPGVGGDLVVVGTRDGEVIGLDAASGETRWISGVTSEVLSVPQVAGDTVVVRSADGRIFGLAADSGRRRWLYERSLPLLTLRGSSTPALVRGGVLAGLDGGRLVALDLEQGKEVWEARVAVPQGRSEVERMVDIDADPVVYRGEAYAVAYQGRLLAVELRSGRPLWDRELSAYAGLGVDAEQVYVTDSEQRIWALDRFTGATVWRQDALRGLALTGPVVYEDYVVVGDEQGYLNWLSRADGSLRARVRLDSAPIHRAPVVAEGLLYAVSAGGALKAYTSSVAGASE